MPGVGAVELEFGVVELATDLAKAEEVCGLDEPRLLVRRRSARLAVVPRQVACLNASSGVARNADTAAKMSVGCPSRISIDRTCQRGPCVCREFVDRRKIAAATRVRRAVRRIRPHLLEIERRMLPDGSRHRSTPAAPRSTSRVPAIHAAGRAALDASRLAAVMIAFVDHAKLALAQRNQAGGADRPHRRRMAGRRHRTQRHILVVCLAQAIQAARAHQLVRRSQPFGRCGPWRRHLRQFRRCPRARV